MSIMAFINCLSYFYIYCFIGWCFESTYVSIREKRLVNRGFMSGPFLPLYGMGAMIMLAVGSPLKDNLMMLFFAGMISSTLIEYITGALMEALFKMRYWDYSNQKLNFKGRICLSSSITWGFLCAILVKWVHPQIIEAIFITIPQTIVTIGTAIITVITVADFSTSFKTAIDIKNMLMRITEIRMETSRLQKRMESLKQTISSEIGQYEKRFQSITEMARLKERKDIMTEWIKDKFSKDKFDMLKRNPTAVSGKYRDLLEELKKRTRIDRWRRK